MHGRKCGRQWLFQEGGQVTDEVTLEKSLEEVRGGYLGGEHFRKRQ